MPTPAGVRVNMARPAILKPVTGTHKTSAALGSWGVLKGMALGSPVNQDGHGSTFGRSITNGIVENTVDGNPATPCLQVTYPGFWRFRWTVTPGVRTISVLAKQIANVSPFPSLILKANSAIGVPSDVQSFASGGTGWSTIGPITITATGTGVFYVELWNNCKAKAGSPALFDHLVFT